MTKRVDGNSRPLVNRRAVLKGGGTLLLLPSLGGFAALLEACSSRTTQESTGGGPEIPIGATVPLTGASAVLGTPMARALEITADDINRAGGPLGRKVKVHVQDDQSDPAAAARAVQKLISVNNIVALLGGNGSSVVLAQLPITTDAKIVDINEGGAPEITGPKFRDLTFRTQSTAYFYPMAHYAKDTGLTNVSAMLLNTTFSQVVMEQFEREWKKLGMTPAKKLTYNPSQPSYAGELRNALQGKPDLLMILGYSGDATIIVKEWFATGQKNRVMGLDFAMNSDFVKAVGSSAANGLIKIGPKLPVNAPGYKTFADRFQSQAGVQLSDYPNAAQTHDQINLTALAIEAAKSTKGPDIAAKLREITGATGQEVYDFASGVKLLRQGKKIKYQGASGPCNFDDSHNVTADFGVWTIDAQGTPQLAKTYSAADIPV